MSHPPIHIPLTIVFIIIIFCIPREQQTTTAVLLHITIWWNGSTHVLQWARHRYIVVFGLHKYIPVCSNRYMCHKEKYKDIQAQRDLELMSMEPFARA